MPKFTKGNRAYVGAKGQGKSTLPSDVPARYEEGFLDSMDGRRPIPRQLKQRFGELVSGLGGLDGLSYQEQSLCKRAIHLERLIEKRELTLAHNGTVDESGYFNAINVLSGLYSKLGMKRRRRIVSLKDYLNAKPEPPEAPQPAPSPEPQPKENDNGNA